MPGAFTGGFGAGFGPPNGYGVSIIRDSLADLRQRIRDEADMPGDYVSDSMLNEWINADLGELYELLLKADETYFEVEYDFGLVADTRDYTVPADVWRIRGVDILAPGGQGDAYYAAMPISQSERNRYTRAWNLDRRGMIRYQLRGRELRFRPTPSISYQAKLLYVPHCPKLWSDADVPPLSILQHWLQYVVTKGAIRCRVREQQDATELREERNRLIERVAESATDRNSGDPETVGDARGLIDFDYYTADAWY